MYTGKKSPVMVFSGETAKKVFDRPKKDISPEKRRQCIKKAKENLKKAGFYN